MLPHRPRGAIAELFRLYLPSVRARCLPIRQDTWAAHGTCQALHCLLELSQMQKATAIERTEVRVGSHEMEAAASGDGNPDAATVDGDDIGVGAGIRHVHESGSCHTGSRMVHCWPFCFTRRGLGRPTSIEQPYA